MPRVRVRRVAAASVTRFREEEFTPTAGQTVFALAAGGIVDGLSVLTVNGVVYAEGTDYTIVGATLTWLDNPFLLETVDCLIVKYQSA